MRGKLVSAIGWGENKGVWSCSLLYYDDEFNRIHLEPNSYISFKVLKGRFCIGHTSLSSKMDEKDTPDSWKEMIPCPSRAEVVRGMRCRSCASSDVTRPCLRCNGTDCLAHPALRMVCEDGTAYVYLASFGTGRIKAGVSQGSRVMKRWIEQGADLAKRVLVGNGREVRRFEKRIQDDLGALRRVKAEHKLNLIWSDLDLEKDLRLIDEFEVKVHEKIHEKHHFHEEPWILLPKYRLPKLSRRPLQLKIRKGLEVSGHVLGVKGPILLIKIRDRAFTLNLNKLIGMKIETEEVSLSNTQSDLDRFFIND